MEKKWVDKVINISRVSIVNKVFVQRIIISLITDLTVYAAQCSLDDSQKDGSYGILINAVRTFKKKYILVIAGDFTSYCK